MKKFFPGKDIPLGKRTPPSEEIIEIQN